MGGMQSSQTLQQAVEVGTGPVSFEDVVRVAREGAPVTLNEDALGAIDRAREVIELCRRTAAVVRELGAVRSPAPKV